jgi:hypothetical protein
MTIFLFKNTPENRARADAISGIMKQKTALAKAETTLMKSKAALPVLLGCGAFALCAGVGGGVALWGYSYITGNEVTARQTAEGVKAVLDKEVIMTKGTVTLAGGGEVALAKGGQVGIDPNTALVRVVVGQAPDAPRSQPEQVRQEEQPPVSKGGVIRNFTVLQTVKFGVGEVHSCWEYTDGNQQRPSSQYCHYTQFAGNATTQNHVLIGENGRMTLPNPSPLPAVDLRAAYEAGCIWANDAAPVAPVAPVQTIQIHAAKR